MKRLYWLIAMLPFITTCQQEYYLPPEEPKLIPYNITGTFRDAVTGNPIEGVNWKIYILDGDYNDAWNGTLSVFVYRSGVTSSDGLFKASFQSTPNERLYLGCTSWPDKYQQYVKIGSISNLYLDINDYAATAESERLRVSNNQYLDLVMYPKAFCKIVLPTLTPELLQDKLVLEFTTSLNYGSIEYKLGDASDRERLQQVREVMASDRAIGSYKLMNGNTVKKQGQFDVYCPPDKVTKVKLEF